jgi:hypothetical protein
VRLGFSPTQGYKTAKAGEIYEAALEHTDSPVSGPRPFVLQSSHLLVFQMENVFFKPHFICKLYIYIQQIGVRIGCYGLGRGTQ